MRVFIGGVMQGSRNDNVLEDQGYRERIAQALQERWPDIEVIDPLMLHPNSVSYDDNVAKETLFAMAELASLSDVVIAFLPMASMGTALEMYMAYQQGVPVLAITPMTENWVVRATARRIFPDLASFLSYIQAADALV